jgi:ANTAR domain
VARPGDGEEPGRPGASGWAEASAGRHAAPQPGAGGPGPGDGTVVPPGGLSGWPLGSEPVARRTATGWRVGDEEVSDLTSAMVLADLLAADLPTQAMPPTATGPADAAARDRAGPAQGSQGTAQGRTAERGPERAQDSTGTGTSQGGAGPSARPGHGDEVVDPERLQVTVAQLEHALSARVRVEQAIGVLAERHRLRPRQAFELLRSVARASGRRVMEVATEVVDSATNPLLRIPEELAKPPVARRRGRIARHLPENS